MSTDTLLNILAVIGVIIAVWRAEIGAKRAGAALKNTEANRVALSALPHEVEQIQNALNLTSAEAANLVRVVDKTGERITQYDAVLRNNVDLKEQLSRLEHASEISDGKVVHMENLLQLQIGVANKQSESIRRLENTNRELVDTNERLRKLVEEQLNAILSMLSAKQ